MTLKSNELHLYTATQMNLINNIEQRNTKEYLQNCCKQSYTICLYIGSENFKEIKKVKVINFSIVVTLREETFEQDFLYASSVLFFLNDRRSHGICIYIFIYRIILIYIKVYNFI